MTHTVALFGGSFNPPHEAHIQMATCIQQGLQVDETWLLFSINPEKDPQIYAPLEHRMAMAGLLVRHFDAPVVLSDAEERIAEETGRHETYHILEGLKVRYPDHKFIWVMGADSFASFHTWRERDDILNNHIVAIVDRAGYTHAALTSPTAQAFADQMIDITDPSILQYAHNGWCFLNTPRIAASSTQILDELLAGKTDFGEPFNQVAAYIHQHGLYGTANRTSLPSTLQHIMV